MVSVLKAFCFVLMLGAFNSCVTSTPSESESAEQACQKNHPLPNKLDFQKSLVLLSDSLSVDGAEPSKVQCGEFDYQVFSRIQLEGCYFAELSCSRDYPGGVTLSFKLGPKVLWEDNVAQQTGDEGDEWDIRTFVKRDSSGSLSVNRVSYVSSKDIEKPAAPTCTTTSERLEYHLKDESFEWAKSKLENEHAFQPKIDPSCTKTK